MTGLNKRLLPLGGILAVYIGLLVILASVRPFWLDEVHQLSDTWQADVHQVIQRVRENPGSVPLGYLAQNRVLALAVSPVSRRGSPQSSPRSPGCSFSCILPSGSAVDGR